MIHRTPFGKFSKWVLIFLNAFSPLWLNLESQEPFLWGFRFCNNDSFSPQVLPEHGSNTLHGKLWEMKLWEIWIFTKKLAPRKSIKWKNEENLNDTFLRNCVKSNRPKAPVAKQILVRDLVLQLGPLLIENQTLQLFHRNWWNISIFELKFWKEKKWSANSVQCVPGTYKYS